MDPIANTALSFAHLRAVNLARCEEGFRHPLSSWSPSQWLVAVGGEVGEALNVVKKITRVTDGLGQFHDTDVDQLRLKLGSELADCVIYLDLLMARCDLAFFIDDVTDAPGDMLVLRAREFDNDMFISGLADGGVDVMCTLGELAYEVQGTGGDFGTRLSIFATNLLADLDRLAHGAGIDLGAAVIDTFNAKSSELGVAHMLEAR